MHTVHAEMKKKDGGTKPGIQCHLSLTAHMLFIHLLTLSEKYQNAWQCVQSPYLGTCGQSLDPNQE